MKTMKINEYVTLKVHDHCESYVVVIDNETKKVKKYHCRYVIMDKRGIQEMVDTLIKNEMITIFGENTTEVHIRIWDIGDGTDELYIETYHRDPNILDNELFDEYDSCMLYNDFLKL